MLAICPFTASAEDSFGTANPPVSRFSNLSECDTTFLINASKVAKVIVSFEGTIYCTGASIVNKIQYRLGVIWTDVANAHWTDNFSTDNCYKSHQFQLSSSGSYRVKVTYNIYGSAPTDVFVDFKYVII